MSRDPPSIRDLLGLLCAILAAGSAGCYLDFGRGNSECGNGVQEAGELCDGTDFGDQTCTSALGMEFGSLGCTDECQLDVSGCHGCGNGVIDLAEDCDDGNADDGDGCSAMCEVEPGWSCFGQPAVCATLCGDGVVAGPEQCDDGNTVGGDGCGPTCLFEACGNGELDPGEACDDGNNVGGDGCGPDCQLESCGNGVVDAGEECDDGNTIETDECLSSCLWAFCGDGYLLASVEVCEPGLVSATCASEGFVGGTIACGADCLSYDTSGCYSGEDGDPCTGAGDCQGGLCWQEAAVGFPAGFCNRYCNDPADCDAGYTCINTSGSNSYCYPLCASSADCRSAYFCRVDPWQMSDLICRPLCTANSDCPHTLSCDRYTGLCGSSFDPTLGDNGEACAGGGDCRGECWTAPTGGYCTSPCNLTAPDCPGGGICSDIFPGSGELGYCLEACNGPADCTRVGYTCQSNPYGSGSVCLP